MWINYLLAEFIKFRLAQMFHNTYKDSLKECMLTRLSALEENGAAKDGPNSVSLEAVFSSSKYVVFYFFRDGAVDLLDRLRHLSQVKNVPDRSSTTRLASSSLCFR